MREYDWSLEAMQRIAPKSDSAVRLVARLVGDSNSLTRISAVFALGAMEPNSGVLIMKTLRSTRRIAAAGGLIALFVALPLVWRPPPEPVYQGKPLSYWVD